jgi:hypothetical protein
VTPVPGATFEVEGRIARIQSVSGGRVRVDLNHPLAGKELEYKVKVVSEATKEKDKIACLMGRNFTENVDVKVEGAGEKKKVIVDIPEKVRSNKALIAMKAGFVSDVKKHLNIKQVEFSEIWKS